MEGGGTKYEHLERIEKQTGRKQIPDFEVPLEGAHLWDWFWDLSGSRPSGFGLSPIPYSEYKSWLEIAKPLIYDWEIRIIMQMDHAFVESQQEHKKEKQSKEQNKRPR